MQNQDKDYVIIPNPIYDVVFRYLMEDKESAKLIISTIMNVKITQLRFLPDALVMNNDKNKNKDCEEVEHQEDAVEDLRLLYIDFAAEIETAEGEKEIVLIEMQKARFPSDIYRFRRYLAKNMQRKEVKTDVNPLTGKKTERIITYKILPIYILNFAIEDIIKDPVLHVSREVKGVFYEEKASEEIEFVEMLSYNMLIVQLPYVSRLEKEKYKDSEYKRALYALLKIFDQKAKYDEKGHLLRIVRTIFPAEFQRILSRLQSANDKKTEEQMNAEDEVLKDYIMMKNENVVYKQQLKEIKEIVKQERQEKERERQEKEKAIKIAEQERLEKEKAIKIANEKSNQLKERDEQLKERNEQLKESMKKLAAKMKRYGEPLEDIIKETGLTADEIENL